MVLPKISRFGFIAGLVVLQFFYTLTEKVTPDSLAVGDPIASHPDLQAGVTALQEFYDPETGLWRTAKWWNSANALETIVDYSSATRNQAAYQGIIANTFDKQKQSKFLSPWFHDDDGWWALTWIKAYDLTGEPQYLEMAKFIFEDMKQGWDSTCDGGIWWLKNRSYKNAIANELFLTVAARLHLRTPGDAGAGSYLDWAEKEWNWFQQKGLTNSSNLVNDGLDENCHNNGQTTWTYNQGVILGGLVDLYKSTGDPNLLTKADAIAHAAITTLAPDGILRESCEPSDCGIDGSQFKGIFIRNLFYLYQTTGNLDYKVFILKNADSIWSQNRNSTNQFGLTWEGPFDSADAVRQSSAIDAISAALALGR